MGLKAVLLSRPHAFVMAPALTEPGQSNITTAASPGPGPYLCQPARNLLSKCAFEQAFGRADAQEHRTPPLAVLNDMSHKVRRRSLQYIEQNFISRTELYERSSEYPETVEVNSDQSNRRQKTVFRTNTMEASEEDDPKDMNHATKTLYSISDSCKDSFSENQTTSSVNDKNILENVNSTNNKSDNIEKHLEPVSVKNSDHNSLEIYKTKDDNKLETISNIKNNIECPKVATKSTTDHVRDNNGLKGLSLVIEKLEENKIINMNKQVVSINNINEQHKLSESVKSAVANSGAADMEKNVVLKKESVTSVHKNTEKKLVNINSISGKDILFVSTSMKDTDERKYHIPLSKKIASDTQGQSSSFADADLSNLDLLATASSRTCPLKTEPSVCKSDSNIVNVAACSPATNISKASSALLRVITSPSIIRPVAVLKTIPIKPKEENNTESKIFTAKGSSSINNKIELNKEKHDLTQPTIHIRQTPIKTIPATIANIQKLNLKQIQQNIRPSLVISRSSLSLKKPTSTVNSTSSVQSESSPKTPVTQVLTASGVVRFIRSSNTTQNTVSPTHTFLKNNTKKATIQRIVIPSSTQPESAVKRVFKSLKAQNVSTAKIRELLGKTNLTKLNIENLSEANVPLKANEKNQHNILKEEVKLPIDEPSIKVKDTETEKDVTPRISESELKAVITRQKKIHSTAENLLKMLHLVQTHNVGKHVSYEVKELFESSRRSLGLEERIDDQDTNTQTTKDDEIPLTKVEVDDFLTNIDTSTKTQSSVLSRYRYQNKYFGAGSTSQYLTTTKSSSSRFLSKFEKQTSMRIKKFSKQMNIQLKVIQQNLDPDATESSSDESLDDDSNFKNELQQPLNIGKRASFLWAKDKAEVVSKFTWLQLQIKDLDFKIRKHEEIAKKIRSDKGSLRFLDDSTVLLSNSAHISQVPSSPSPVSVNGYRGTLPGNMRTADGSLINYMPKNSARTRPFLKVGFKKRKLVQTSNLHTISNTASHQSTVRCGCNWPTIPCALCTGRSDPTAPRDAADDMNLANKLALVEPTFHNYLSFNEDIPCNLHFDAILKLPEWQTKMSRSGPRAMKTAIATNRAAEREKQKEQQQHILDKLLRKVGPSKKGRKSHSKSGITAILPSKKRKQSSIASNDSTNEDELCTFFNQPGTSSYGPKDAKGDRLNDNYKRRNSSFDIDNIVIPYSVAASTRVEVLQYKEIITPKWRVAEADELSDDISESSRQRSYSSESEEDISEEAALARHKRAEIEEHRKFGLYAQFPWTTRSRANRRIDSRAESNSGQNTPDPMSPAPSTSMDEPMPPSPSNFSQCSNFGGDMDSCTLLTVPSPTAINQSGVPTFTSSSLQGDQSAAGSTTSDGSVSYIDPASFSSVSVPAGISSTASFLNLPGTSGKGSSRRRTLSAQSKSVKEDSRGFTRDDSTRSNSPLTNVEWPQFPFEKRQFPLNEDAYNKMLSVMPVGHPLNLQQSDQHEAIPEDQIVIKLELPDEKDQKDELIPSFVAMSSDSDSQESQADYHDPNDPEWG